MFTNENNIYWQNFSKRIDADFEERQYWYSAKTITSYKNHSIVFDNYAHSATVDIYSMDSIVTRVYCTIQSNFDLQFKLSKAQFLNKLIASVSQKLIKTDDVIFDKEYSITSKNKKDILPLFQDREIRRLISKIDGINLEIGKNKGIWEDKLEGDSYELSVYINKTEVDYHVLKDIKNLFEKILDKLTELRFIC